MRTLLAVAAAAALATTAAAQAAPRAAVPVRPAGERGPLVVYDAASGRRAFALPPGLLSADGSRFAVARAGAARTRVTLLDPATGRRTGGFALGGRWTLGGIAPGGRWLALEREGAAAVVSAAGRVRRSFRLRGDWDVDTLSRNGRYLFLIQHLPAVAHTAYVVWVADVATGRMTQPSAVGAEPDEGPMAGYAHQVVASPDGRWFLTLYVNPRRGVAFVHALDVRTRRPACIDLPSGSGRLAALESYSLALAPDGRTLLAANPALGIVADVDLTNLAVARTRLLAGAPAGRTASAVAADGTLVVASGRRVWTLPGGTHETGRPVVALATSGGRVYAALAGGRLEEVTR